MSDSEFIKAMKEREQLRLQRKKAADERKAEKQKQKELEERKMLEEKRQREEDELRRQKDAEIMAIRERREKEDAKARALEKLRSMVEIADEQRRNQLISNVLLKWRRHYVKYKAAEETSNGVLLRKVCGKLFEQWHSATEIQQESRTLKLERYWLRYQKEMVFFTMRNRLLCIRRQQLEAKKVYKASLIKRSFVIYHRKYTMKTVKDMQREEYTFKTLQPYIKKYCLKQIITKWRRKVKHRKESRAKEQIKDELHKRARDLLANSKLEQRLEELSKVFTTVTYQ
jgi:hypothetical protein